MNKRYKSNNRWHLRIIILMTALAGVAGVIVALAHYMEWQVLQPDHVVFDQKYQLITIGDTDDTVKDTLGEPTSVLVKVMDDKPKGSYIGPGVSPCWMYRSYDKTYYFGFTDGDPLGDQYDWRVSSKRVERD